MFKKIAGPTDQRPTNFFKLTVGENGCCPDGAEAICQSTVTYTQANTVTLLNITEAGVARALPAVPATTSAADVKTALYNALITAGYEDDDNSVYDGITVVDNGTTLTVTITGRVTPVSLTTSGGAAAFDADCALANLCTYALTGYAGGTTGTAATTLRINGANYDIGTVTPGTTSAATVKAAIDPILVTAGISGVSTVTTSGSGGATVYAISITPSEALNEFYLNGVRFTRSGCSQQYV